MESILAAAESDLHSVCHFSPTSHRLWPDFIALGR